MKIKSIPLWSLLILCSISPTFAQQVLVEAESFESHGGWKLDTQFIENMGSPYPLAPRLRAAGKRRGDHGHVSGNRRLSCVRPHQGLGRAMEGPRPTGAISNVGGR